jgi:predicted ATPase
MIDFSRISEPNLVPAAVAAALQLEIRTDSPLLGLIGLLKDKEMLLVLDNCEHIIEYSATLATEMLKSARGIHILVTSREPLRSAGERVYRLPELPSPPAGRCISASEALAFSAVQLFAERVAAIVSDFELSDEDAAYASRICRELDGIPLAIEFAAARADTLGIRGVATALDDRLGLLAGNQRGTPDRHRTIRATLEWSYNLLSEAEKIVLRGTAIFSGSFTLESACAVIATCDVEPSEIANAVSDLALKSLVVADIGYRDVRFRLLETTRIFALAKLSEGPDHGLLARRHAFYYCEFLAELQKTSEDTSKARLSLEVDNVRAALTWAHGPRGDRSLAISLTAASAFVWLELSLLPECQDWTIKALDLLNDSDRGGRSELVLQSALGLSARFAGGMDSRVRDALRRASELAEQLREPDLQLQALSALIWVHIQTLDLQGALAIARRGRELANLLSDPGAHNTSDTMLTLSHFYLGDVSKAALFAERVQGRQLPIDDKPRIRRWRMDSPIYAKCIIAQIQWVTGYPEQALRIVNELFEEVSATEQPVLLCLVRAWTANVLLAMPEPAFARKLFSELRESAAAQGLVVYEAQAVCLEGLATAGEGDHVASERLLRRGIDQLRKLRIMSLYMPYLGALAELLGNNGRADEGLIMANEAFRLEGWWAPDSIRIKGKLLMLAGSDLAEAERLLLNAIELSKRQSALLLELRSAMDLNTLRSLLGRPDDGVERLKAVYSRFTEGFDAPDLRRARRMIDKASGLAR